MNTNTVEFWLEVKSQYIPEGFRNYICDTSHTFRTMWSLPPNRYAVAKLAADFLKISDFNERYIFVKSARVSGVLFSIFKGYDQNIRKEFIDWCIQKFSDEKA